MTIILNIETSTKNCSISFTKNGTVLFVIEKLSENYSHAEKIHCFLASAIEANLLKFSDIKAICVNKGPGSFTGLKIGFAIAKGLCYGLNKPLLTTDALSIIIEGIRFKEGIIISIIYTKSQDLYLSIFNENKIRITNSQVSAIRKKSYQELSQYKIYFLGNEVRKAKYYIKTQVYFLAEIYPSSQEMAFISYKNYQNKKFEILSKFEPCYCK